MKYETVSAAVPEQTGLYVMVLLSSYNQPHFSLKASSTKTSEEGFQHREAPFSHTEPASYSNLGTFHSVSHILEIKSSTYS